MRRAFAAALLAGALVAPSATARELWRSGEASLELSGEVRELPFFTHGTDAADFEAAIAANLPECVLAASFPDCPAFDLVGDAAVFQNLLRLRLRLDGHLSDRWSAAVVYDNDVFAGKLDTLGNAVRESFVNESFLGAEGDVVSSRDAVWRMSLYRAYVRYEGDPLLVVVGRQRIPWGVGRLWTPIDRFNAIPPLAIEGDESPGVDAVDLRWSFGGFTFLEGVFAAARDFDDSSYALRLHGVFRDIDYSAMAGVFEQAITAGFDLTGNVGDATARLEVVYADPTRSVRPVGASAARELPSFWQVIAGIDRLFDVGNGIYALIEHLYNGNALGFGRGKAGPLLPFFEQVGTFVQPTTLSRFGGSRVVTLSSQLTGLELGYDLTPEIRADVLAIYDWEGGSASFFPQLRYTPVDWLELRIAAQLFVGPRLSEYGSQSNAVFLIADAFF